MSVLFPCLFLFTVNNKKLNLLQPIAFFSFDLFVDVKLFFKRVTSPCRSCIVVCALRVEFIDKNGCGNATRRETVSSARISFDRWHAHCDGNRGKVIKLLLGHYPSPLDVAWPPHRGIGCRRHNKTFPVWQKQRDYCLCNCFIRVPRFILLKLRFKSLPCMFCFIGITFLFVSHLF